ncbi:MAG TPA: DUF2911 domain-containing protein [Acidobacteriaceae bacterium]|nr:DUF2911 domain-containing protein [Acidobacteriaceae bacterium]
MKLLQVRWIAAGLAAGLMLGTGSAQMPQTQSNSGAQSPESMPSPPATASVTVAGGTIDVKYSRPKMRGRKIMGALVPYGQVWRTGANPATTIITSVPLKFGDLLVPAGTHTLYTLPNESGWQLIINNQTGQWGTEYHQEQDLGRVPMQAKKLSSPQEVMSISFENTKPDSTELHVRWENTDEYVTVRKP